MTIPPREMSDVKVQNEMDSQYTSKSALTVYSATKHTSSVRMDCVGIFDGKIYIHEDRLDFTLNIRETTMLALRDVLNRWHEDQIVHRGRP